MLSLLVIWLNSYGHHLSLAVPTHPPFPTPVLWGDTFLPLFKALKTPWNTTKNICLPTQEKARIPVLDFTQDSDPSFPSFTCGTSICLLHSHLHPKWFHVRPFSVCQSMGRQERKRNVSPLWRTHEKTVSRTMARSTLANTAAWLSKQGPPHPSPWL